jgi:hypothetical protein
MDVVACPSKQRVCLEIPVSLHVFDMGIHI